MSPEPAVVAENISKRYVIGRGYEHFPTLRDAIVRNAAALVRLSRRKERRSKAASRTFMWALRDVSFEIDRGDAVGFVGRNGAGKSTLLKVISRITAPTAGHAEVAGRVGALLEVGTGFNPELTGRDNIFLNGAILGMPRAETRRKFDAIVDFAGVEAFIDTPIKRYSSGMQVRLAFSVAAHLDTDILIVDEVLAVGDLEFQRKCLGKMGEYAQDGRTVLFVSHNMAVVQSLCRRAMFLESGRIVSDGPVREVVDHYLRTLEEAVSVDVADRSDRDPGAWQTVRLEKVRIVGSGGEALATGRPARFEFHLNDVMAGLACRFVIHDNLGLPVASFDSGVRSPADDLSDLDDRCFVCEIDAIPLVPGRYRVDVTINAGGHLQDGLQAAAFFRVEDGTLDGRPVRSDETDGPIAIAHRWSSHPVP